MNKLEVNSLSFAYNKKRVIEDINLCVPSGSFVGIIGPNGSGKSTILKNIYGSLRSDSGTILLDGEDTKKLKSKYIARKMAVVGQENTVPFNFSVQEIVSMGRTSYKKLLDPDTSEDRAIVNDALKMVSAESLAERDFSQLSGGEKQRVLIARALEQQTDFIVLDEPTNHLDICFQLQIFEILKKTGKTVLAAVHDLNLALMFCDILYVLNGEKIICSGNTDAVLNEKLIREVFNVDSNVIDNPPVGKKYIVFMSKSGKAEE